MQKLRLGIIGIGRYAAFRHVPAFRDTGLVDIVAISRRNPQLLNLAKMELEVPNAYQDWKDLLATEQLDGVVVSTSASSHPEPTIAALEQGLHVLVEKPMALTGADASRMTAAAKQADRLLVVGCNCRFRWQWRWARSVIEQGALGQIRQVSSSWCMDGRTLLLGDDEIAEAARARAKNGGLREATGAAFFEPGYWRLNPQENGPGLFVDAGTHIVDLVLWLCGHGAAEVVARSSPQNEGRTTNVSFLTRLRSDVLYNQSFNDAVAGDGSALWGEGHLSLWGDEGTLSADWSGMNPRRATVRILKRGMPLQPDTGFADDTPAAAFVRAIRTGSANPSPPDEAERAVYLLEAALMSMEGGRPVEL
jgi:predicted dehydrogenase